MAHQPYKRTAFLALLAILATGCINRQVSRQESGQYVDGKAFAQIKPGETSGGWVKSLLGDPSEIKKTETGTEIWKWSYRKTKSVNGELIILQDHSVVTSHRDAMVEVKNGIVINKWFSDRDFTNEDNFN